MTFNPFIMSSMHKKTTFHRILWQVDHVNAVLHHNNTCYSLSTSYLPGLGQLVYMSSYLVLRAAVKEGNSTVTVQMKKLRLKQSCLGSDWCYFFSVPCRDLTTWEDCVEIWITCFKRSVDKWRKVRRKYPMWFQLFLTQNMTGLKNRTDHWGR